MQNDPFVILGVTKASSKVEINTAYDTLMAKYREDRFLEGEAGAYAAKMCTVVNQAYTDIMEQVNFPNTEEDEPIMNEGGKNKFGKVESLNKDKNFNEAQAVLDDIMDRNAEWHYFQALIYHRKNWLDECKKQLEIALELEPSNSKYKQVLDNLKTTNNANESFNKNPNQQAGGPYHQSSPYNNRQNRQPNQADGCCNCCSSLICADCCCECMGGDLISCC